MIFKRTALKLSTKILLVSLVLITIGLFASNMALKAEYKKLDKRDKYWNYTTVLSQPFKHLKIDGGNVTQVVFEQAPTSTVRLIKYWTNYKLESAFKAYVSNDTLHISMAYHPQKDSNKEWMENAQLIRISAPQLLSIEANNIQLAIENLKQNSLNLNIAGHSKLWVKSLNNKIDSLNVVEHNNAEVHINVTDNFKGPNAIDFQHINANLNDGSFLDVGRSYTNDLKLNMADSSSIILSGKSVSKLHK
jgi:hypothetical protein